MNFANLPNAIVHDLYSTFCMENAEVLHPRRATTEVLFLLDNEPIVALCHWRPIDATHFSAHFSIESRDRALCVDVVAQPGNAGAFIRIYYAGEREEELGEYVHTLEQWRELIAPQLAQLVDDVSALD